MWYRFIIYFGKYINRSFGKKRQGDSYPYVHDTQPLRLVDRFK